MFIPHAGIQNDEALFANPLYGPTVRELRIRMFHTNFPLMVMTYIGTLKTLLYWPILKIFGTSVWSLRIPVLVIGAISVYLFGRLTGRVAGLREALIASLILATDPVYLLTDAFDWGPVALEHLLLIAGCYLLYRFNVSGRSPQLAAGFFCLGLGLWNKAIFIWALSGLVAGAVLVFWPELKAAFSRRNGIVAGVAFFLGCGPFVIYNLVHKNATGENVKLDTSRLGDKWIQVKLAANGASLYGYLVTEESDDSRLKPPQSAIEKTSVWVRHQLGPRRETYFYYALGALLLCVPWWWRSRAARLALVFMAVAWLAMALTKDAGGSVHHVVLLWPFPVFFAVMTLRTLPGRWTLPGVGIALILLNFTTLNQHFSQLARYGAEGVFSDAFFPLAEELGRDPKRTVYLTDWGLYDALLFQFQGRLSLQDPAYDLHSDLRSAEQTQTLQRAVADPEGLIVGHVQERELFTHNGQRLIDLANAMGYRKQVLRTIADSNGRPVFEIFHFSPNAIR
jgi:hypothetical protein